MPNTNNKIPTVSLNKYDICSNTEQPIPSQEINPSSQKIPQKRCSISLINRPQPCCCHDFFAKLFLPRFFSSDFFSALFLSWFFYHDFSVAFNFSTTFFCHNFFSALFLLHFFCNTFPATLFLPHFFYCNFSLLVIPVQITFHKNRYSSVIKMREPCLFFLLSCIIPLCLF
jgi:hypothetical protein